MRAGVYTEHAAAEKAEGRYPSPREICEFMLRDIPAFASSPSPALQ